MDNSWLLRGMLLGLSIAAPVGPIGLLCIRRTLSDGNIAGLLSGLGAATADAVYGSIAGFGLTYIASFLVQQQMRLRLVGGIFLCYLGIRIFFSKPELTERQLRGRGWIGIYASTFLLTLTNPVTILSFTAVFAGMGLGSLSGDYAAAVTLVVGVFLGSVMWWLLVSTLVGIVRVRINDRILQWVNRLSGMTIATFGVVAIFNLAK